MKYDLFRDKGEPEISFNQFTCSVRVVHVVCSV